MRSPEAEHARRSKVPPGVAEALSKQDLARRDAIAVRALLLLSIRAYRRFVSPLLPGACRFTPTCSAYALEAVRRFGAWRGGRLAAARLLRCRPFGGGGEDPVPD